ncbi:hypothetical protein ABE099_19515 [Paenibacillus turicensis]|uniref:hypothetical protein n=1 Tax=Paenibacillus turicensis TaxID=160487 RepID=UPI003D2720BD
MKMMLKQKRFKITIISFLVVTLLVVSFTYMKQKVVTDAKSAAKAEIIKNTELHVLNAEEHPEMTLDGAVIMIMPDMEVFIGGDVVFHKELTDVKYMKISYYYIEDGDAIPLRVNVFTTEGSEHGMSFKKQDMGTERGENLISTKKVALFNDILRFSAEGTFMNGERFEYTTKVNVKKVY